MKVLPRDTLSHNFGEPSNLGMVLSEWKECAPGWTVLLLDEEGYMVLYSSIRPDIDRYFGFWSVEALLQQLPHT